jgi:peptidyl-dipeptidase Dcp
MEAMNGSIVVMLLAGALVVGVCACSGPGAPSGKVQEQGQGSGQDNPLLSEWKAPFEAPPFGAIGEEHFRPAFEKGMQEQLAEVAAIAENPEPPTFENTVESLERSGQLLTRVDAVFSNLNSAHTNDEMQALAKEINPRLAKHTDDIFLDEDLFARIKTVYEARDERELTTEQRKLLEETYLDFVRGGANLAKEEKARLRLINEELSRLATQFGENLLKEMNSIALLLDREEDLAGLPASVRDAAATTAAAQGHEGKWGFTLQRTSWTPFLQFSERRDLRRKLYTAYTNMGNNDNEYDNKAIAARLAALRAERSDLLGYGTHADFVLEKNMAERPERVFELLDKLWEPALAKAKRERAELQALIAAEGETFELQSWDWWFYAEKLREAKYAIDEQSIKAYLELDSVRQAAFDVAGRLFGITFEPRGDVPVYHPDVAAYEVKDADGSHLALYYVDYFTRESKRGGAWMNNYREQWKEDGRDVRPIVVNVCNFSKPSPGQPALLSVDEARTLFHEFGHALHGILADGTYESLSGTNVPRDFVELPSQMMENWAFAPEVLPTYARHHETGEPIPDELVTKLQKIKQFNQGFATTEYLAASILDMRWHTLDDGSERDALAFEAEVTRQMGLIPEVVSRYRTPYFGHIFSGGYSAGYYSYIWAEVLDADGFEAFERAGLFDAELARSYRENILEAGGTEPPMDLYRRFRGSEPSIEPLLARRGLEGQG